MRADSNLRILEGFRWAAVGIAEHMSSIFIGSGGRSLSPGLALLGHKYFVEAEDSGEQQDDERDRDERGLPSGVQD